MRMQNFKATRLIDSSYRNVIQKTENEVLYCEIQYQRDRSSFAGAALKITGKRGVIEVRQCEEKIINDLSEYEKLYIGCEQNYIDSMKEIFTLQEKEYGIEIFFLLYSNVRSSQIIFEELMQNIDKNIDIIQG